MPNALRRRPRQARSQATRDAIFEAAAQILEAHGEDDAHFNTNRIAERAGVSVGTLYQYFATKQAILAEMARRENARVRAELTASIPAGEASPVRLAIRAQIAILQDRPATRRAALRAIMAEEGAAGIRRETRETGRLLPPAGDRLDAFVLTQAVNGVIRAAVLEGSPHLRDPRLEDTLVRLVEGFQAPR
ncbi:MAG: TetR/AcrR family transcriptional regulator [Phenylobacterium zucineum]|nr:MAG: TetR/AcrR family transcriptional regulator [Phenylobacterium zucineum]